MYSFVVPANGMGANGSIRFRAVGDILNNTGVPQIATFIIKLNVPHVFRDAVSIPASTVRRPWQVDIIICNQNNTAIQAGGGTIFIGPPESTQVNLGIGDLGTAGLSMSVITISTGSQDTTSNMTVAFSIDFTNSDPNLICRRQFGYYDIVHRD